MLYLIAEGSAVSGANLSGADLRDANLSHDCRVGKRIIMGISG